MSINVTAFLFLLAFFVPFSPPSSETIPPPQSIQFVEASGTFSVINNLKLAASEDDCRNACLLCKPSCERCLEIGMESDCPTACVYCNPSIVLKPKGVLKGVKPRPIRPCPEPPMIPIDPFKSISKCDMDPDMPQPFRIFPVPTKELNPGKLRERLGESVQKEYRSETGAFVYREPNGKGWVSVILLGEISCLVIYRNEDIFRRLPVYINGKPIFS
ncbi:MAG: hypothetical protein AAF206_24135 [Bacteroidota bacterium]